MRREWEQRNNSSGARALLQRGLRTNPRSESLWLAYLRFELLFAARLWQRRRKVVAAAAGNVPDTSGAAPLGEITALDTLQEGTGLADSRGGQGRAPVSKADVERVLAGCDDGEGEVLLGGIAAIAVKQAWSRVGGEPFARGALRLLEQFKDAGCHSKVKQTLLQSMEQKVVGTLDWPLSGCLLVAICC